VCVRCVVQTKEAGSEEEIIQARRKREADDKKVTNVRPATDSGKRIDRKKKDNLNKILKNIKEYRERKRNREKERLKMRE